MRAILAPHSHRLDLLLFAVFAAVITRNFFFSYRNAMSLSIDMQWFPSGLFWNGINPYQAYLENGDWFLSQMPNYGHLLYLLLFPLACLDWDSAKSAWALVNMVSFLLIILLAIRRAQTSTKLILSSSIVLAIGYPLSNAIENGQTSIIMALALMIGWIYRKNFCILTIALSILFVKFTFGIPILFGFFLAGYRRAAVLASLINFMAVIVFLIRFESSFFRILLGPIRAAQTATGIGPSDLMSLGRLLGNRNDYFVLLLFAVLIGVVFLAFAFATVLYSKFLDENIIVGSSVLLSMGAFFHLGYDYVMLLLVILIVGEKKRNCSLLFLFLLGLSFFLWQCNRFSAILGLGWHCSTNMSVGYTSIIASMIILIGFLLLASNINSNRVKSDRLAVVHPSPPD